MTSLGDRLAGRVEALVAIPSESGEESAILAWIREQLPAAFPVVLDGDAVLFARP